MRVLFAAPMYLGFIRGGILAKIPSIKQNLERLNIEVDVINLLQPVERGQYDILHLFSSVASFDMHFVADNARKNGMKIVFNPIIYGQWPAWVVRAEIAVLKHVPRLYNWHVFLEKLLKMSDLITPNTSAEANYISAGFGVPRDRLQIVANGTDDHFAHGDPELMRKKTGFQDFILTVGYVSERKNQLRVLKAAEQLGLPLVVIGKLQDDAYCREFLRTVEGRKDVAVFDQMPNDDPLLASAYAAASAFVLASWWETPGRAALDAALAGAPVVITRVGGTADYFGEMADYVNYASVNSIRHGIERALARPKDGRLREHVRANFTWSRIAVRIATLYGSLLNGRAASGGGAATA